MYDNNKNLFLLFIYCGFKAYYGTDTLSQSTTHKHTQPEGIKNRQSTYLPQVRIEPGILELWGSYQMLPFHPIFSIHILALHFPKSAATLRWWKLMLISSKAIFLNAVWRSTSLVKKDALGKHNPFSFWAQSISLIDMQESNGVIFQQKGVTSSEFKLMV